MEGSQLGRRETVGQVIRFLIVGGANTLITYAIFVGLGLVIAPWLAYTIAFVLGLLWVSFGSARIVFRSKVSARKLGLFCGWYLLIFGVGQLVIRLVNPSDFVSLTVTSLIVLICTTPLTFIGGKYLFRPTPVSREEGTP